MTCSARNQTCSSFRRMTLGANEMSNGCEVVISQAGDYPRPPNATDCLLFVNRLAARAIDFLP